MCVPGNCRTVHQSDDAMQQYMLISGKFPSNLRTLEGPRNTYFGGAQITEFV